MDKEIQELLEQIALEGFFVKSSKGNYLTVTKQGDKWIAQGKEVTRESDIEYLNKQYENTIKDLTKTYNNIMEELEYGLWDSGNLSISQQKILDYLLEKGICVRTPGVPGEHDTANGVAKWIYSLNINESEEEQLHNRLTNNKRSKATEKAWKKYHGSYMRGARKRSRNMENKTFYGMAKDLEAKLENKIDEAQITGEGPNGTDINIRFENITGGLSLSMNKNTGYISISVSLGELGNGNYRVANSTSPEDAAEVCKNIKDELLSLCSNFDDEIKQLITRYGLKSTK